MLVVQSRSIRKQFLTVYVKNINVFSFVRYVIVEMKVFSQGKYPNFSTQISTIHNKIFISWVHSRHQETPSFETILAPKNVWVKKNNGRCKKQRKQWRVIIEIEKQQSRTQILISTQIDLLQPSKRTVRLDISLQRSIFMHDSRC